MHGVAPIAGAALARRLADSGGLLTVPRSDAARHIVDGAPTLR